MMDNARELAIRLAQAQWGHIGAACPKCGSALEIVDGEIGEVDTDRKRPATFLACSGCEFCEEVR